MCNPICTMRRLATVVVVLATLLVSSLLAKSLPQKCLERTRPHTTRCDQYFQCVVLPSKTSIWITTHCQQGLIYQHSLGFCVVPDSNWECELSADNNHNRNKENFYGIDNLFQLSPNKNAAAIFMPTTLGYKQPEYNLTTALSGGLVGRYIMMDQLLNNQTQSRSSSASFEESESSGGGNVEQSSAEGDIREYSYTYLRQTKESTNIVGKKDSSLLQPLDRLSLDYLNNMLAKTTHLKCTKSDENCVKNVHDLGTLPLPPDGKIHPEHLTQIINQQKLLNLIAAERKQHDDPTGGAGDHSPFTNQAVFMQKPIHVPGTNSRVGPTTDQQHGTVNSFIAKEPYVSDDIIRSIQQISQQMIVNQKPPTNVSTPLLKSTLYPFMKNGHITNTSCIFSANPIGITFTNHHDLAQSMVFDDLKKPPVNEPSSYSVTENMFSENYSNRPVQKEIDQSINRVTSSSSGSLKDAHTSPTTSKFVLAFTLPLPAPSFTGDKTTFSRPKHPLFTQLLNDAINRYGASEQMEKLDSTLYKSGFKYHSNSDLSSYSVENTYTFDDSSADRDPNETNTQFKRKLFTLGNTIIKRNQYKDSKQPMLDAQLDEVRISIATCTFGGREPNKTDCFKYYVCNRQNGTFQSFTCPFFTAFNKKTRLCDTETYQSCRTQQAHTSSSLHSLMINNPPSSKTKLNHLQNELVNTQTYFEFINQEADKQNTQYVSHAEKMTMPHSLKVTSSNMSDSSKPPVKIRRKSSTSKKKNSQSTATTTTTTSAPKRQTVNSKVSRCRFEGRMPDPSIPQHYYVCTYRKNAKKFVKMKLTCPTKLTYCPSLQFCTAPFDCFS